MERTLVPPTGIHCRLFPMAPPTSPRGIALLSLATLRSLPLLWRRRPRAALATGGYVSTPASTAAWLLRVPIVLFLPDVVPGKAVRWLIPLARRIAVSTEDSLSYLPPEKTTVTGYPVREWFRDATKETSRAHFQLPAGATVLCVAGGSQGARSINDALAHHLPSLLDRVHVLHICGEQRLPEAQRAADALTPQQREHYRLYPYLEGAEMAQALAAADLVLCRSGASVLGELPATGTPGLLVPLPEPSVHQRENAEYLARRGAAVLLENDELASRLAETLDELLSDRERLARMAIACRALDCPGAAADIAGLIAEAAA
jgi:UDP-N-acetylglucosamine--N-acetylmuramyl-(pentapeptide) pyrophosphoryl-undecaprenol N-acetylglucosamine transferase